ncbi:UDP-N-acetylglucosamine--N-acetylmuramyl-(pentapeptide) pyrophosphoryl-undecaprenol N-acetylglucosamine transferase [Treponema parvum]|uniref:UDP-N-acetylglucosamine--N-acetylmuramyl-(pentapeptide) pyrophosphoryl-undecaprenol N-acetylglucosamine transferase n=1 Tax=Treponema parvum TaxID=138851 RepID=A0A975IF27_9SPIR|nr:UDP-N-acetylglucosamine--N-acetylmuramyl-(pentapeptide) pyrophosphoryl-undecaprenol N-acetylglucosamine transferase [Treponema parvum]QTQ13889.1 UDP-N-acetylglucosamine--N-acetylmuramyl-(pentapeptide) pyrophosphoryl-undecaprenol N-acetylglucosamine transferase [Treponema parvum]
MYRVVFTGGGTGGHIYPGIAVADELKLLFEKKTPSEDLEIYWIGNRSGMDRMIVEKSMGPDGKCSITGFYGIPSGKFRRNFSFKNFIDVFKILGGLLASFFILLKLKPDLLFSKGGFVSVPPCICAGIQKIPVYTHECDFTPGLATRINSKSAFRVLLSYTETKRFFSVKAQNKLIVTGNPVRPSFFQADKNRGLDFLGLAQKDLDRPLLLVLGGSSGSKQINDLVAENLLWLTERFIVIHQTGRQLERQIRSVFEPSVDECPSNRTDLAEMHGKCYKPYEFIYTQMPDVIACSDIVLCRAGSNSLWECAVLKKPMVLIPLCGKATRGDQVENASYFEKNGAALTLVGDKADSDHLKKALTIMEDKEKRNSFSAACEKRIAQERPAAFIASLLYNKLINNDIKGKKNV